MFKKKIVAILSVVLFFISVGTALAKKEVSSTLEDGKTGKIYFKSKSPYMYLDILDALDNDPDIIVFGNWG